MDGIKGMIEKGYDGDTVGMYEAMPSLRCYLRSPDPCAVAITSSINFVGVYPLSLLISSCSLSLFLLNKEEFSWFVCLSALFATSFCRLRGSETKKQTNQTTNCIHLSG